MSPNTTIQPQRQTKTLIYIVDDEPVLLDFAEAALRAEGFRTKKFTDPNAALSHMLKAKVKPTLLITDYAMGKMNGLELIEKCRSAHPGLKAILVSGTAGAEILLDAPVRVDRFLSKPFQSESLVLLARKVVEG